MTLHSHCTRRDGRYYFRVRIPTDLVKMLGRSEIRKSLGTSDPKVARRRAVRASGGALRLFDRLRLGGDMLTPEMIADIVRSFYENWLNEDNWARHLSQIVPEMAEELTRNMKERASKEQTIIDNLARCNIDDVRIYADNFLVDVDMGDEIDEEGVEYRDLCHGLLRALLEVSRRAAERDRGIFYGQPTDPLVSPPPSPPPVWTATPATRPQTDLGPESRLDCLAHVDAFLAEKKNLTAKSKADYRKSLATFAEVIGSKSVADVTAADVVKFKNALLITPKDFRNRLKVETVAKAIEKNKARSQPLDVLDAKTINEKYLSNVKSFFAWAAINRLTADNPAEGIRAEMAKRQAKDERDPFEIQDLNSLFGSPLYKGCASSRSLSRKGDHHERGHRFWTPLLGLFTGCRLNELGQMQVSDIEDIHGILHFAITKASDDPNEQKRLKTPAGRRYVPIHPELQSMGFLDHVAEAKRRGHVRLFPAWTMGKDGYFSSPFSKWFSRYLNEIGTKTGKTSFHSFRHCFADALRNAELQDSVRDYFMGHDDGGVAGRYGSSKPPESWSTAFQRLGYEGLDLSHLYKPQGTP